MTVLPPPRTIKVAIVNMDSSVINKEGIEKLLYSMLPTEEEKEAILWLFRLEYEAIETEITDALNDLKLAIQEIRQCETLRCVFSVIVAMGNFLNDSTARGFNLDYLAKVPEVRDTVHKHTLLHHVCHMVQEQFPNSGDLYSELGAVTRCSKLDWDEVQARLDRLERDCMSGFEHHKALCKHADFGQDLRRKLESFLRDAASRIVAMKIVRDRVMNRFRKLLLFLGMTPATIADAKVTEVMHLLSNFALEYRTNREKVRQQISKKQNAAKRRETRGKLIVDLDGSEVGARGPRAKAGGGGSQVSIPGSVAAAGGGRGSSIPPDEEEMLDACLQQTKPAVPLKERRKSKNQRKS
uniref:FH2 domain-containing protein n=1 Tax=Macrostomum lignano TaxID=282301 RepID=A0A1I8HBU7_9PLAT